MAGIVKAPDGGDAGFPITSWTLIREAQGAPSEERARLLNELFARYRQPLWAFFYAKCRSRNEADDLIGQL